jgi:hypothetical protein
MDRFSGNLVMGIFVLAAFAGCDTTKVTEAVNSTVDSAKNTVNKTVEVAKQEVNLAGSMEVTTTPPIAAKACYAKLVLSGGQRPNVLQLASYKGAELERFPSMMLYATTEVDSPSELAGKTLKGELFAQSSADGTVWQTRSGSPASITISQADGKSLTAQISSATLLNSSGEEATVSGKFVALFE